MRQDLQSWRVHAACLGMPVEWWIPDEGMDADPEAYARCQICPVHAECFEFAIPERWGMWAGTSARQRQRIRNARGIAARELDALSIVSLVPTPAQESESA